MVAEVQQRDAGSLNSDVEVMLYENEFFPITTL